MIARRAGVGWSCNAPVKQNKTKCRDAKEARGAGDAQATSSARDEPHVKPLSSGAREDFRSAILDCDAALQITPGHTKGLLRRALALRALGRLEEAFASSCEALRGAIETSDKRLIAEFVTDVAPQCFVERWDTVD